MHCMEEILIKADELGSLIRKTEIYLDFQRISDLLAADSDAAQLFKEFQYVSSSLKERQNRGDIIEKYEMDELKSLLDLMSVNDLIMQYVKAQKEYLNLLLKIQDEISIGEIDFSL